MSKWHICGDHVCAHGCVCLDTSGPLSRNKAVSLIWCAHDISKTLASLKSMNLSVYAIGDDGVDRVALTYYYDVPPASSLPFMH
jgi:hypothetical protein